MNDHDILERWRLVREIPGQRYGTAPQARSPLGRHGLNADHARTSVQRLNVTLRVVDTYGDAAAYDVIGEPVTVEGAKELAASDPYQFQWWALS